MTTMIIYAIFTALVYATVLHMTNGGTWLFKKTESGKKRKFTGFKLTAIEVVTSLAIGVMVGAVLYFVGRLSPETAWIAIVFTVVMLGLFVHLVHWGRSDDGIGYFRELVGFIILAVLFYDPLKRSFIAVSALWDNQFWTSVAYTLPAVILALAIGILSSGFFFYLSRELANTGEDASEEDDEDGDDEDADDGDDAEDAKKLSVASKVVGIMLVVATLIVVVILLITGIKWSGLSPEAEEPTAATVENSEVEEPAEEPLFPLSYNLSLLYDDDLNNDCNFGYDPYEDGMTAEELSNIHFKVSGDDPGIGVAMLGAFDRELRTRFLGEFYDENMSDGEWAKFLNGKVAYFADYPKEYYYALFTLETFLKEHSEEKLIPAAKVKDHVSMLNYGRGDKLPDIIVAECDEKEAAVLVYSVTLKDRTVEVPFTVNCLFQWTTVIKEVKTPTPNPNPTPTPTPTPTPEPDKPTKDPTKGTHVDVGPNDDYHGTGLNTNTGKDAQYSLKDQPENSDHTMSYGEYREVVVEHVAIDNAQQTGNDDGNTPSRPTPVNTAVDNNGDNGNGGNGINQLTKEEGLTRTENGTAITNNENNPLGAWEGPAD